jgi:hypothetical protein
MTAKERLMKRMKKGKKWVPSTTKSYIIQL